MKFLISCFSTFVFHHFIATAIISVADSVVALNSFLFSLVQSGCQLTIRNVEMCKSNFEAVGIGFIFSFMQS